LPMGEVLAD